MPVSFLRKLTGGTAPPDSLDVNGRPVPLVFVKHPRARRYVLRLRADGAARVTIPRGGSMVEATRFAASQREWLERQFEKRATQPPRVKEWRAGMEIMLRGEMLSIQPGTVDEPGLLRLGEMTFRVDDPAADLRRVIEARLWRMAARELPPRVMELAALHGLIVRRVSVRNQKSRWGSCSQRGTVSLNWRLIQTPEFVRDYIILHELMHLRQMNHSSRFWREVKTVCPDYAIAERWLKENGKLLR
ncbi:MAG TPA: SprT family zinc-dependent metalloprotease [Verrucomicrobiae bacterium]|nr:SprT family zinc-dependent metalloprotease [Verrucomicrobiae bacterium]